MTFQIIEGHVDLINDHTGKLWFDLAGLPFDTDFTVQCPNETDAAVHHTIVKNGHSANTKAKKQQFYCKTCGVYFFIHKSKYFMHFEEEIKAKLTEKIALGHVNGKNLSELFNWSVSSATRYLDKVLETVVQNIPQYQQKWGKIHAKVLFMDETFLKIGKKTWYLIMGITDTGQILAVELREHRDQETLIKLVRECESKLDSLLEEFITDGLSTYKGVALALGHDLIHVRHIHKPPYGRIEVDTISHLSKPGEVKITTFTTANDIFQNLGCFLARVEEKTISILHPPPKKRGRKAGGKNRSKAVIDAEKQKKLDHPGKRGRPKKYLNNPVHIFRFDKEKGCILPWGESSHIVADVLNKLHHIFGKKCITTNLMEKEFSVLKILICFRGRRSLIRWKRLITAYCWIRNNPFILSKIIKHIPLSGTAIQAALTTQIKYYVSA